MISARSSDAYLHSSVILNEISEEDIFKFYCSNFKGLGIKFCSDLRKDSRPSVSIALIGSNLLYKDFGYDGHTFNCFGYVMQKFNISFIEALRLIASDFNLKLTSSAPVVTSHTEISKLYHKKHSKIQIKSREWGNNDYYYWGVRYQVSKKLLIKYNVIPISYFWVNNARFKVDFGYAFKFSETGYKIYQPYETESKWFSNIGGNVIQGYSQLPDEGELVIITSSLKDVLVLTTMGYNAVAPQSERVMSEDLVSELKDRFRNIVVLYDNDFNSEINPGQTAAKRMCDKYSLANLVIPDAYECKDISDLVDTHGFEVGEQLIKELLKNV